MRVRDGPRNKTNQTVVIIMAESLLLFGNDDPTAQFETNVETVKNLSEDELRAVLDAVFAESHALILPSEQDGIKKRLLEQGFGEETRETTISFLRNVVTQTVKYDLSESELQQDFEALGFDDGLAGLLSERIDEESGEYRTTLVEESTRTSLPRLRDVRWKLAVEQDTARVRGANRRTVILTFVLQDGGDTEEISVEVPEDEFGMLAMASGTFDELLEVL